MCIKVLYYCTPHIKRRRPARRDPWQEDSVSQSPTQKVPPGGLVTFDKLGTVVQKKRVDLSNGRFCTERLFFLALNVCISYIKRTSKPLAGSQPCSWESRSFKRKQPLMAPCRRNQCPEHFRIWRLVCRTRLLSATCSSQANLVPW